MSNIRFKIDEKSLFIGEYNDYKKGQTATVSSPLNQNSNPNKWRKDILKLRQSNCKISNVPEMLERKCKQNSKAGCKITDVFVFNNLLLDGKKLDCNASFAMYIKEETDKYKRHKGILRENLHFGRLKLHYPISLKHESDGFNIDNKKVLNSIIEMNGGFAYIVRGFEYNEETKTLNFITSLTGPKGIPLSTIFRRQKGVGKKLMIDPSKVVDNDYVVVVEENTEINKNDSYLELLNKTRAENGKLGEEKIYKLLQESLKDENDLYHTSLDYPQSPYDIEYIENGEKQYVEVKATSGTKLVFNMSSGELKFMEKYKDNYTLYLITEVKEEFPTIKEYHYKDIMKMKKEYPTVRFFP